MSRQTGLALIAALSTATCGASPVFVFTEGQRLVVADSGGILSEAPIAFEMAALAVVPDGVSIGGAQPGDVIGTRNNTAILYRVNDPLGQPNLEQLAQLGEGSVDLTFAEGVLYGVARENNAIIVRRYDTETLEVAETYQTGINADGFGGLAYSASEQVFYITEKNKFEALFRWVPGETAAQVCKPPFAFGNNDLEQAGDTIYGAFATDNATMLRIGPLDTGSCAFQTLILTTHGQGNSVGLAVLDGGDCYADFTGDGVLDLFDFLAFVNAFNAADPAADCDGDQSLSLFDFLCFTNEFNAGC